MRRWVFWFACVLVLGSSSASFGQEPSGPRTLENLLQSDDSEKSGAPAAADGTDAGPKRPEGPVSRPRDGVQHPDLDKAWVDYGAAVAKATEAVKAAIAKQFDAAAAKGDLDAADKWQVISEKFEKAGELPAEKEAKTAVSAAAADYKKAREELASAYEAVIRNLTMDKKITEAKEVRKESEAVFTLGPAVVEASKPSPTRRIKRQSSAAFLVGNWTYVTKSGAKMSVEILKDGEVIWSNNTSTHKKFVTQIDADSFLISDIRGQQGVRGWHVLHVDAVNGTVVCDDWKTGPRTATLEKKP